MSDSGKPNAVELSASEQAAQAEALFHSIGDGAITTDEFGRITRINPVAQQILGYTKKELIGQWFPSKIVMIDPDDRPINLIDRPITKAFLTGKPIYQKAYYRHKNGQRVPVSINVSPILTDGKPLGAIEVFRDISFEEEVDRIKSEFISLASHQLRTPLSSIKTYTHMIRDGYMGQINDAQGEALRTIIEATDRMNELISTLLNITRMESGAIATTTRKVRIDVLIREIIKEFSASAAANQLNLTCSITGNYSNVIRTDRTILKEIIINLVTNAIKYTPPKGFIELKVRLRKKEIMIEVSDTGWGIPKYSQDQIFSKFFRAENITRRETTGTGLGLYLVKGLVDSINGKIWFESSEGKGTDFFLSLPRPSASVRNNTSSKA